MDQDLCYLSAVEATRLFRKKELSPVELMVAVIHQAEAVEPEINAFSYTYFEQAMAQAKDSENRYLRGEPRGSLDGLAMAVKEEASVAGQPVTEASLVYKDRMADEDGIWIARLRQAGAIFHARSTCPEFSSLWNTHSRLFGLTRNPWNLNISPGGSSGGAAAALAAGSTTLATGSDIGGSIRQPSSQCGLTGFNPPYGRVPDDSAPFNLDTYCANGPMARSVGDCALMQNVMSGFHPADAASHLPAMVIPETYATGLAGFKIAYSIDFGYRDVEQDVRDNTQNVIAQLRGLGAEVEEVEVNWMSALDQAYVAHIDQIFGASIANVLQNHRELLCDYNVHLAEISLAQAKNPMAYYQAAKAESATYGRFSEMMGSFDAFICPTVFSNRLKADFNPVRDEYTVNGKALEMDIAMSTCHYFNAMGRCPSMSVPSGIGENGVPTGLQIASTAYDDIAVFTVAAALESAREPVAWPRAC